MKLDSDNSSVISLQVVPYIGTWIETVKDRQDNAGKESRTLLGTWIETIAVGVAIIGPASYLI